MTVTPKATVVPFVVRASGSGVSQQVEVDGAPGHTFRVDTYPAFGGRDASPSPLSYALGALSSCNQITASIVARELGITLGAWSFEVRGDLDTAVMVLGEQGNAAFDRVAVSAAVETDATAEQLDRLRSETERRCPVTQMVRRSVREYVSDWTARPLPA